MASDGSGVPHGLWCRLLRQLLGLLLLEAYDACMGHRWCWVGGMGCFIVWSLEVHIFCVASVASAVFLRSVSKTLLATILHWRVILWWFSLFREASFIIFMYLSAILHRPPGQSALDWSLKGSKILGEELECFYWFANTLVSSKISRLNECASYAPKEPE